jgi:hypothetical protein
VRGERVAESLRYVLVQKSSLLKTVCAPIAAPRISKYSRIHKFVRRSFRE